MLAESRVPGLCILYPTKKLVPEGCQDGCAWKKRGIFKVNAVLHWHFLCAAAWNTFAGCAAQKTGCELACQKVDGFAWNGSRRLWQCAGVFQESKAVFTSYLDTQELIIVCC